MRAKLTPDYPIGCKRILFDNTYYRALARPNVTVETGGLKEVGEIVSLRCADQAAASGVQPFAKAAPPRRAEQPLESPTAPA